ncbi:LysM peptidoglycan-binding domain-containing protein, partial [Pseudomethylobacillus aquaticus]
DQKPSNHANWRPVGSADFSQGYDPISPVYPGKTGTQYTVQEGDTLQGIAQAVWGDGALWFLIADANGLGSSEALVAGTVLSLPNKVTNVHNTSGTFRPYSPGEAMGDTSPTLPAAPAPPGLGGCGGLGAIIVIVIVVVATVMTAGALAPVSASIAAGTGGVAAGTFATGVAVLGGTAGLTAGVGLSIGLAAGAIGSIAGQVAGMAMGVQDKFSWSAVATSAIGSGLGASGALGGVLGKVPGGAYGRAISGNVINQGIGMITGAQKGFSWAGVAAAAIAAPITDKISQGIKGADFAQTNQLNAGIAGAAAGVATGTINEFTRIVIEGGKVSWMNVAAEGIREGIYSYGGKLGEGDPNRATARINQFKGPDGEPLWKNEDQRAALIDLLNQDPAMTPEKFAHDQKMAMLADAAYLNDVKNPQLGFRDTAPEHVVRVTNFGEGDLAGFTQSDFENDEIGFSASLFRDTRDGNYTLSYRGTDDSPDWRNGNVQALSPSAPQYKQAINLAQRLQAALGDRFTDITGHSLGGGAGAAASMLTGIRATTFNAAGLNPETVTSRGGTWDPALAKSLITNYRVNDEVLTSMQERGSIGSLPLSLLTPIIGPPAVVLNGLAAALPDAAGRQITINAFDQNNRSMSWLGRNNLFKMQPIALHGMDYIMRGMLINKVKGSQ